MNEKQEVQEQIDKFDAVVRPIIKKYAKNPKAKEVEDDLDYKDEL